MQLVLPLDDPSEPRVQTRCHFILLMSGRQSLVDIDLKTFRCVHENAWSVHVIVERQTRAWAALAFFLQQQLGRHRKSE